MSTRKKPILIRQCRLIWQCSFTLVGKKPLLSQVAMRPASTVRSSYLVCPSRDPEFGWPGVKGEYLFFSDLWFFFVVRRFLYEFVRRRQICFGSFCCVLALYVLSLVAVTCDNRPLRIISNFHFGKQKIHSRLTLLIPWSMLLSLTIAPLCHNFSFVIQFTSNSLVPYNSHRIFSASQSSVSTSIDTIVLPLILNR